MEQKHTPWFPASVKPARAGVYERKTTLQTGMDNRFSYWSPRRRAWMKSEATIEEALENKRITSWEQSTEWRGLTKKAGATS